MAVPVRERASVNVGKRGSVCELKTSYVDLLFAGSYAATMQYICFGHSNRGSAIDDLRIYEFSAK